jgi:hypothetical protein
MNVDKILEYCDPHINAEQVCDNFLNGSIYEDEEVDLIEYNE